MSNLRQAIEAMMRNDGVYLVSDSELPKHPIHGGAICMVMFVTGGQLWSLKVDCQMDPERFRETAKISGPFLP